MANTSVPPARAAQVARPELDMPVDIRVRSPRDPLDLDLIRCHCRWKVGAVALSSPEARLVRVLTAGSTELPAVRGKPGKGGHGVPALVVFLADARVDLP